MDPMLMPDFERICSFGGRLAGSGQDSDALDWTIGRLNEVRRGARRVEVSYDGWVCEKAELLLLGRSETLSSRPLLRSMATPPKDSKRPSLTWGKGARAISMQPANRFADASSSFATSIRFRRPTCTVARSTTWQSPAGLRDS